MKIKVMNNGGWRENDDGMGEGVLVDFWVML